MLLYNYLIIATIVAVFAKIHCAFVDNSGNSDKCESTGGVELEALVYIFGILLVLAAAFGLIWKTAQTVRNVIEAKNRAANDVDYVVTEYVKDGKVVAVNREKKGG